MPNELASPLAEIIRRAAAVKVTDSPLAKVKKRFVDCSDDVIVVCDCSGSMTDLIGSAGLSKQEHLRIALQDVLISQPKIKILAFASQARFVKLKSLPNAGTVLGSGTDLGRALQLAARSRPRKTIVISDGLPDSEPQALDAADKMTGAIDTIYCGPDAHPAVLFLQRLARESGGVQVTWDGYKPLAANIRGLLTAG